jgi:UDP-glucose/GDP-mannose dehydrogenase family, UDP binding domain
MPHELKRANPGWSRFPGNGDQRELFGLIASVSACWRPLNEIAADGCRPLVRITAGLMPPGAGPGLRLRPAMAPCRASASRTRRWSRCRASGCLGGDRALGQQGTGRAGLQGLCLVLLVGVTYKKDSADLRETPVPVARKLLRGGARLSYADPYVREWQVDGHLIENTALSADAVEAADPVILLQAHSALDLDALASRAQVFLDTRGASHGGHRL